jgi:hypothetical protein
MVEERSRPPRGGSQYHFRRERRRTGDRADRAPSNPPRKAHAQEKSPASQGTTRPLAGRRRRRWKTPEALRMGTGEGKPPGGGTRRGRGPRGRRRDCSLHPHPPPQQGGWERKNAQGSQKLDRHKNKAIEAAIQDQRGLMKESKHQDQTHKESHHPHLLYSSA